MLTFHNETVIHHQNYQKISKLHGMESEFTVPPYSECIYCIDEAARLPYNLSASKVITPQRPVVQILINLNSDLISTHCSIQNNKVPNQADIFPTNCKLLISVTFVFSR